MNQIKGVPDDLALLHIINTKGRYSFMSEKFEELITQIKANDLVKRIRKQEDEKKGHPVIVVLAIIGAVAAVAAIAYAVYKYLNPSYADFDADFDYDEFEDDFDDLDDEDTGDKAFSSSGK